eukprot:TRINITY_DN6958_c0_g3_i1.p1 TRINITY_DN6958_c0_g3~~TRINITY_DN6958_c0_g3_i1.p1  ORF type:complete len:708 (+),score=145.59 TRINITY_DN6958_c0_g3_i1:69-2126(+)
MATADPFLQNVHDAATLPTQDLTQTVPPPDTAPAAAATAPKTQPENSSADVGSSLNFGDMFRTLVGPLTNMRHQEDKEEAPPDAAKTSHKLPSVKVKAKPEQIVEEPPPAPPPKEDPPDPAAIEEERKRREQDLAWRRNYHTAITSQVKVQEPIAPEEFEIVPRPKAAPSALRWKRQAPGADLIFDEPTPAELPDEDVSAGLPLVFRPKISKFADPWMPDSKVKKPKETEKEKEQEGEQQETVSLMGLNLGSMFGSGRNTAEDEEEPAEAEEEPAAKEIGEGDVEVVLEAEDIGRETAQEETRHLLEGDEDMASPSTRRRPSHEQHSPAGSGSASNEESPTPTRQSRLSSGRRTRGSATPDTPDLDPNNSGASGVLRSFYERNKKVDGNEAKKGHEHDDEEVEAESRYQEGMKRAKMELKQFLVAEKKSIVKQSEVSKSEQSLVDRIDNIMKDLDKKNKSQSKGSKKTMRANLNRGASTVSEHSDAKDLPTETEDPEHAEGADAGAAAAEAAAGAEEDAEDYDSDDAKVLSTRYSSLGSKIMQLEDTMEQAGFGVPKENEAEVRQQQERVKKGKAKKMTTYEKTIKHEVESYQSLMKERLQKLGETKPRKMKFDTTADPAEAVKDAVLRYHKTCEKLGKLYAFNKDEVNKNTDGLTMEERRRLGRFLRGIQDNDPDRYKDTNEDK